MRSANGRHRRPRQAPALIVAAGVTGSAIAIPLFAASGASAADASTWDRVAECESGGSWSADVGNGYYGGLMISRANWTAFGGTDYAASPDLASRSQQIAIADRMLEAQGTRAWPSCAPVSGLKAGGGAPAVDPGSTPEASGGTQSVSPANGSSSDLRGLPADTADAGAAGTPAAGTATAPGGTGTEKKPARVSSPPVLPSTSPSGAALAPGSSPSEEPASPAEAPDGATQDAAVPAQGKHRGGPSADAAPQGVADDARDSGRHASRGDASARDGAVGEAAAEGAGEAVDGTYVVREGDSLWAIADEHKVAGGWNVLYETNQETIGADADLILPGQSLELSEK